MQTGWAEIERKNILFPEAGADASPGRKKLTEQRNVFDKNGVLLSEKES